jgi:hypothetical protein
LNGAEEKMRVDNGRVNVAGERGRTRTGPKGKKKNLAAPKNGQRAKVGKMENWTEVTNPTCFQPGQATFQAHSKEKPVDEREIRWGGNNPSFFPLFSL